MPYRDETGPQGQGPLTGRGFGSCGGGRGLRGGSGFGRGRGRGFGRGSRFWSRPLTKEEEKKDLEDYKKGLEAELEAIKAGEKRLEEDK